MGLQVKISQVDSGKRVIFCEYEDTSMYDTVGELYRGLMGAYGRCTSKVYIDTKSEGTKHIGWVFEKRMKYEDSNKKFLCETWVSVLEEPSRTMKIEKFKRVSNRKP